MAFHIPEQFHNLFDEVDQQFRLLIRKQVITGIDDLKLDSWLANFLSDEDYYLAARILHGLMFRSKAMICSSIDQLLQCVLPGELRKFGLFPYRSIEEFLDSLSEGNESHPLRFIAIDGSSEREEPGKSGVLIIRHFRQHARIAKSLTCRPENLSSLPSTVKCLIFADDIIGTGKQFGKFAKHHKIAEHATSRKLIYCPLIAVEKGMQKIVKEHPWLLTKPIELLNERHQFYHGDESDPKLWAADGVNTVEDVRSYVMQLAASRGIPATTEHGLDLLLGFEHATPNNTLPLLWSTRSPNWKPLLVR